jgi:heme/copper-type cytochrome/quinol oxidase subunit 2
VVILIVEVLINSNKLLYSTSLVIAHVLGTDKSSTTAIYTMVFLGFMGMILIPTVVYLIWKVRQQKKQLRYLTQEEVEEFLLGKPDFIPFESDMSTYAYYLPYDKNYEIAKDDLEIGMSLFRKGDGY